MQAGHLRCDLRAYLVNTIEAAALQAIREYYALHDGSSEWRGADRMCQCRACRKARTFAELIGVDLDKEDEA